MITKVNGGSLRVAMLGDKLVMDEHHNVSTVPDMGKRGLDFNVKLPLYTKAARLAWATWKKWRGKTSNDYD